MPAAAPHTPSRWAPLRPQYTRTPTRRTILLSRPAELDNHGMGASSAHRSQPRSGGGSRLYLYVNDVVARQPRGHWATHEYDPEGEVPFLDRWLWRCHSSADRTGTCHVRCSATRTTPSACSGPCHWRWAWLRRCHSSTGDLLRWLAVDFLCWDRHGDVVGEHVCCQPAAVAATSVEANRRCMLLKATQRVVAIHHELRPLPHCPTHRAAFHTDTDTHAHTPPYPHTPTHTHTHTDTHTRTHTHTRTSVNI